MHETATAAKIVEQFLIASMVPDPVTAARYISPDLKITFTGGRTLPSPERNRRLQCAVATNG